MCTNKHYITNSRGKRILVKCGHCPACLQEKAMARAQRIKRHIPTDGSVLPLFVTLTYRNECVPYFYEDELMTAPVYRSVDRHCESIGDSYDDSVNISIYRDVRCCRYFTFGKVKGRHILSDVSLSSTFYCTKLKPLQNDTSERKRIGCIYYPDVQMFLKRLRQNLKRKYHYDKPISYFACSEYGPRTCRPHFHLLLFFKSTSASFGLWQRAISEAWPYDSYSFTKRHCEIARDAAHYVSSYVNCVTSVPAILQTPAFRPKHSFSQGFGFALESLSLPKVLEAFKRRDLHFDLPTMREGVPVVVRALLPKYAFYRYFPKFKGYSRLTSDEIASICYAPSSIYGFAEMLSLSKTQCHRISVMLSNKISYAYSLGIDKADYIEAYSHIYTTYYSNLMHDFYDSQDLHNFLYSYDNIIDYYIGVVDAPTLDFVLEHEPLGFYHIVDPNEFPDNVRQTYYYTSLFYKYDKQRKVTNQILSSLYNGKY